MSLSDAHAGMLLKGLFHDVAWAISRAHVVLDADILPPETAEELRRVTDALAEVHLRLPLGLASDDEAPAEAGRPSARTGDPSAKRPGTRWS